MDEGYSLTTTSARPITPHVPREAGDGEGPLTPRNDAGPFVFDGSAGRVPDARPAVVVNGDDTVMAN